MGRKNHLGKRIPFSALPDECKGVIIRDYKELWSLESSHSAAKAAG